MSEYYLGEIRIFAGNFEPSNWKFCNGQVLPIQQYEQLYSLIGTVWGGDGHTNFALPDLRGRVPVGQGTGPNLTARSLGQMGGSSTVGLTVDNLPAHSHSVKCTTQNTASLASPSVGGGLATIAAVSGNQMVMYAPSTAIQPTNTVAMDNEAVSTAQGNGIAHNNLMPYLALNYIICVTGGLYPSHG